MQYADKDPSTRREPANMWALERLEPPNAAEPRSTDRDKKGLDE